jgi:hypothetical protein
MRWGHNVHRDAAIEQQGGVRSPQMVKVKVWKTE